MDVLELPSVLILDAIKANRSVALQLRLYGRDQMRPEQTFYAWAGKLEAVADALERLLVNR